MMFNAYVSCQNYAIPCAFVSALSYTKTARTAQDNRGFNRSLGYEPGEISVRVRFDRALCEAVGEDYNAWLNTARELEPRKQSTPTPFYLNGNPLYASLLFALTSVNRTDSTDVIGDVFAVELDLVFSGVACAKEMSRDRALVFGDDASIAIPTVMIECNGKTIAIESAQVITQFKRTERGGVITVCIGTDENIIPRDWMTPIMEKRGFVIIDGFRYFIFMANLVDEALTLYYSVFDASWTGYKTKTYRSATVGDVFPSLDDITDVQIDWFVFNGDKIETLERVAESLGFLVDFPLMACVPVPDKLTTNNSFVFYVSEDLQTQPIGRVVWRDGRHEYSAGDGENVYYVDAVCCVNDSRVAQRCLKRCRYMQNRITITAPIEPTIKQHSVFNIIKGDQAIPVMVEAFEFDYMTNQMTLDLHYLEA